MLNRKYISLDGVKLAYYISDSIEKSKPVILFGHSYMWNADMWFEQIEQLKERFTCIATDLPAHGKSDLFNDKDYSIQNIANLHARFMTKLGIEKYAVVGLSVGGMWGTQLALSFPEVVTHLMIMGTFVGEEPKDRQQEYFYLIDELEKNGYTEEFLDSIVKYFFTPYSISNNINLLNRFKKPLRSYNNQIDRLSHLCEVGRKIFTRVSLLDNLHKIKCPFLIAVGEKDIPRPPSESRIMANLSPKSKLEVIKDAAHISNLEQVDKVTKLISDFLP